MVCKHWTHSFLSIKCNAGVDYKAVRDQNRRWENPRYPCRQDENCFTTCELFEPDLKLAALQERIDQTVYFQYAKDKRIGVKFFGFSVDKNYGFFEYPNGERACEPIEKLFIDEKDLAEQKTSS